MDTKNIKYYCEENDGACWHYFDKEWVFYMNDSVLVEVTAAECMTKGAKTLYAIRTKNKGSAQDYYWIAVDAITAREALLETAKIIDLWDIKVGEEAVAIVKITSDITSLENWRLGYDWRENLEEAWKEALAAKKEAA